MAGPTDPAIDALNKLSNIEKLLKDILAVLTTIAATQQSRT
jgi:hypothetical protein